MSTSGPSGPPGDRPANSAQTSDHVEAPTARAPAPRMEADPGADEPSPAGQPSTADPPSTAERPTAKGQSTTAHAAAVAPEPGSRWRAVRRLAVARPVMAVLLAALFVFGLGGGVGYAIGHAVAEVTVPEQRWERPGDWPPAGPDRRDDDAGTTTDDGADA